MARGRRRMRGAPLLLLLAAAALVLLCGGFGGSSGSGGGIRGASAYLFGLNIFSFNVTATAPLAPVRLTVPYMMSFFGPNILTNSPDHRLSLNVRVPPDTDASGCGDVTATSTDKYGRLYAGQTAVILFRNGCTFAKRVAAFASIGVKLVVFYACSPDAPFYCAQGPFETITGQPGMNTPSINTDWLSGQRILAAAGAAAELKLDVWGTYNGSSTGQAVYAPDAAALRAALLTNPTLRYSADMASGTYPWTNLLLPAPAAPDPCAFRLLGTWCERGRIVSVNVWTPGYWEGTVPDELGLLSELRYLSLAGNKFNATGCGLAALKKVQYFSLSGNRFAQLPACLGNMTAIEQFSLNGNALTSLPAFDGLVNLKQYDVGSNQLTVAPVSPSWATTLQILTMASNAIRQPLPNFAGFSALQTVDLSKNAFYAPPGGSVATFFDNSPQLVAISLGQNDLSGALPNLSGTTALIKLDLSYNRFNGTVPATWSALTQLQGCYLQHNELVSPFDRQLGALPKLESLDLSYNLLTSKVSDPTQNGQAGAAIAFGAGPALKSLNLAYNRIAGAFGSGYLVQKRSLVNLNIAGNQITNFPLDIFGALGNPFPPANTLPNIQTLDFSYNNMSWQPFVALESPLDTPPISLQLLKLQGNPLFVSPVVPTWAAPDGNFVLSADGRFACPGLQGKPPNPSNLVVNVDPAFYQYQFCVCANGTYGTVPDCQPIPFITPLDAALSAGQRFSDTQYGNQRYTRGIDTNWVLSAPAGARVLYVHFDVNRVNFTAFTDVIEVYEGVSIQGALVVSYRGTDVLSKAINNLPLDGAVGENTVVVLNASATVNFRSRASGGFHFNGSYDFSFACPTGYSLPSDTAKYGERCTPLYEWPVSTQTVVFAIAAFTVAVTVGVLVVVLVNYNTLVIRAASGLFCVLILVFNLTMAVGAFLMAVDPVQGDAVCHARAWLTGLGVVGSLSCLVAKTERIRQIFTYTLTKQLNLSNWEVVKFVLWMMLAEVVLLIAYSAYPFTYSTLVPGTGATSTQIVWECADAEAGYTVWTAVQFCYIAVFMVGGAFVAFYTRDVPLAYNETTQIVTGLWVLSFFGAIVVPLQYVVNDNPQALMLMRGVGEAFCSLSLTLVIFVPKVFLIVTGQANNRSITTQTNSALGQTTTSPTSGVAAAAAAAGGGSNGSGAGSGIGSGIGGGGGSNPSTPKGGARKLVTAPRGSAAVGSLGSLPPPMSADAVHLSRFPASVQEKIQKERAAAAFTPSDSGYGGGGGASHASHSHVSATDSTGRPAASSTATLAAGFDDPIMDLPRAHSILPTSGAAATQPPAGPPSRQGTQNRPPSRQPTGNTPGYKPSTRFSQAYGSPDPNNDAQTRGYGMSVAPPPPPPDADD